MGLRSTEDVDFGKKKIIFSDEIHFDLSHLGHRKPAHIHGKANAPKRVTVWCEFWSQGIIWQFFFENKQKEAVTVNDDHYRAMLKEFLFTKIKRRILAIFGLNRTALRATQPKLHSMFSALFLKITLSAAELMSFGHLVAAI